LALPQWAPLGPFHLSGCIFDIALDPHDSDRIYAAASDGGLWRMDSINAYRSNPSGNNWIPLTDRQPSLRIQCVTVSPADGRVYYADSSGTLFVSADMGVSWSPVSQAMVGTARRLVAHPSDPGTVYVAASTGLWSTANGITLLQAGDITDATVDLAEPSILYAAQRGMGVLHSVDGGANWATVLPWTAADTPKGTMIKVAVGEPAGPVTGTIAAKLDQEVFLNDEAGAAGAWQSLGKYGGDGWGDWCHVLAVDPHDNSTILAGAQALYQTRNAGSSWTGVMPIVGLDEHVDQQRVIFDSSQPGVVYVANDGGVYRSPDHGTTWAAPAGAGAPHAWSSYDLNYGLVTAQFSTAAVSGDNAVGDVDHWGEVGASSLAAQEWAVITGWGEADNVYGDPVRPGRFYIVLDSEVYDVPGMVVGQFPNPNPNLNLPSGGNYYFIDIAVDQSPGSNVLIAATKDPPTVLRSHNGDSAVPTWTPMQITLPLLPPPNHYNRHDTVWSLACAPSQPQLAYALTGGGLVFVCPNIGDPAAVWSMQPGTIPAGPVAVSGSGAGNVMSLWGSIAVSYESPDLLYAIAPGQVFRSQDGAKTWEPIPGTGAAQLPAGLQPTCVLTAPGRVYVA
jgi:hypothetical protein